MKVILEIRSAEGGEDSKLLVKDQASIYIKYSEKHKLSVNVLADDHGWIDLSIEGNDEFVKPLLNENGGHRWQRVPPTERKGRVHTSTVTIVVLEVLPKVDWKLKDDEIQTFVTKDSGPGGQHRNKTESCIVLRHLPTGIEAKSSSKCQHQNRKIAREMLESRVKSHYKSLQNQKLEKFRSEERGSGMRGDKIRTYREKDDTVIDHRTDLKFRLRDVRNGKIEDLLKI